MFSKKQLTYIYNCINACHDEFEDLVDMADESTLENSKLYEELNKKLQRLLFEETQKEKEYEKYCNIAQGLGVEPMTFENWQKALMM